MKVSLSDGQAKETGILCSTRASAPPHPERHQHPVDAGRLRVLVAAADWLTADSVCGIASWPQSCTYRTVSKVLQAYKYPPSTRSTHNWQTRQLTWGKSCLPDQSLRSGAEWESQQASFSS